jgi:hypothetical protein
MGNCDSTNTKKEEPIKVKSNISKTPEVGKKTSIQRRMESSQTGKILLKIYIYISN